jgi:hypothetical protein
MPSQIGPESATPNRDKFNKILQTITAHHFFQRAAAAQYEKKAHAATTQ